MSPMPYWNALSARRRAGLAAALLGLAGLLAAGGAWLLHDPLVPLVSEARADRIAQLSQALEQARVAHRVTDDGHAIAVARSQLGKARAAAAGGGFAAPPSVGLEVFKDADFSTTDFAQRVNYQRALQGELARTLEALAGVRRARVHLTLPEAGLLRRASTPASAAIGLAMAEGHGLTRAQVRGIQRLVAASVPGLRPADVAVFDEAGVSLGAPASEGEAPTAQLDLKRQVDGYLEAKLARLLEEVVGDGQLSLSVDATLDERQLRVTTEEPVAAVAAGKTDGERPAGVLTRERQVERGAAAPSAGEAGPVAEPGEWEAEYRVGQRVEQTLAVPGSIRRLSVAVAVRGAAPELRAAAVEQLVAHGIGLDRARGDAVAVVLLPAAPADSLATSAAAGTGMPGPGGPQVAQMEASTRADEPLRSALPARRASATGATGATSATSSSNSSSSSSARSATSATSSARPPLPAGTASPTSGVRRSSGSVAAATPATAHAAAATSATAPSTAVATGAAGAGGAGSAASAESAESAATEDPRPTRLAVAGRAASAPPPAPQASERLDRPELGPAVLAGLGGLAGVGVLLPLALRRRARRARRAPAGGAAGTAADREAEADALAARIRGWLEGGD